ncbi:hypothetical protein [Hespellia stercorisuis]|uniref:hypothetical protein n=1 Tax=Hespellia stercorisuis TaxID=180311 RepID=UPI00093388F2|nr:hypothetical protein [Hespellia stercorisuis]
MMKKMVLIMCWLGTDPQALFGRKQARHVPKYVLPCTFWTLLADLDEQASERYECIVRQMKVSIPGPPRTGGSAAT